MKEVIYCPAVWLILFLLGPGIELLPPMRRFRAEQAKYPRFHDIPCDKTTETIITLGWIIPIVSIVMACVSLTKCSSTNILICLGMFPVVIGSMIIIDNVTTNGTKINLKDIILLGALVMEIGSIGTTMIVYVTLYYSECRTVSEYIAFIGISLGASTITLLCVFILVGIFALATNQFKGEPPEEEKLKKTLKFLPLFNPVLSPITIPLFIIFVIVKWICNQIRKILRSSC